MTVAPELAELIERVEAAAESMSIDWHAFRKCPVCRREIGAPCVSASGTLVNGRPDGKLTPLRHAHVARKRRTGR